VFHALFSSHLYLVPWGQALFFNLSPGACDA
jgi:hypothetical protein